LIMPAWLDFDWRFWGRVYGPMLILLAAVGLACGLIALASI